MKRAIISLTLLGLATSALAVDRGDLDNRVRKLTVKFEQMQQKPDKRIPAETLRQAQGIILLDRTKAGFLFAFQGGNGIAMVRDPQTHQWGPVAFLDANEASLGFQVGGQQSFVVMLLMNSNVTRVLAQSKVDFGGEARGTAGNASAGVEGTVSSPETHSVLAYDDRSGFFGGASVMGGGLSPDDDDNSVYYSRGLTASDILFDHKVQPTEAAVHLAGIINQYSQK